MRKFVKRLLIEPGVRLGLAMLVVLFFSCEKRERVPDGILTTDQMVTVLSELYISEQKISTLGISRDSLRQIFGTMEGNVFDKVNSTDSVFRQSLTYYMDHPQTLELIYTALVDSLSLREQRLISGEEE